MAMERKQKVLSWITAGVMLFSVLGLSIVVVLSGLSSDESPTDSTDTTASDTTATVTCQVPADMVSFTGTPANDWPVADPQSSDQLVTEDLRQGSGDPAKLGDCIIAHYRLASADGTPVSGQDTFASGQPFAAELSTGQLIQGWTEGIPGMKVGGLRRLFVPSNLAYGDGALIFDVELLDIATQ
jgi:peptidylprolyl isomerase